MTRTILLTALVALAICGLDAACRAQGGGGGLLPGPRDAFTDETPPPAPDYDNPATWGAFPGQPSAATETPPGSGLADREADAKVDVFFIHPTTYDLGDRWNAAWDEGGMTRTGLDQGVLRGQASVFNGCCRIFAPRYRQAELMAFVRQGNDGPKAIDLAYSDVARAFDWYLAHENHGRPFIIASHSQGSNHAMRLLQEKIIGTPLQTQLVAAIIPGSSLPAEIATKGLPLCDGPTSTGCVANWNSVARSGTDTRRLQNALIWWDGRYQGVAGRPIACVNPLTWAKDGGAEADKNLGALATGHGAMTGLLPAATGAWCKDGLLGIDIAPEDAGRFNNLLTRGGIYHVYDYGLYWLNIRRNVEAEVAAWLAKHPPR